MPSPSHPMAQITHQVLMDAMYQYPRLQYPDIPSGPQIIQEFNGFRWRTGVYGASRSKFAALDKKYGQGWVYVFHIRG